VRLAWGEAGSWHPDGGREVPVRNLAEGDLIAVERALWRVIGVQDVPVADWDRDDREHYGRHTMPRQSAGLRRKTETGADGQPALPEAWSLRPVHVTVQAAKGDRRVRLRFQPYAFARSSVYVIPAHHPVCAACGELYPCRHLEIDEAAEAGLAKLAEMESVLPGCCWHCREPVTSRQKQISFPGENLLLPGGPPPVFHLRDGKPYCGSAALVYERRWIRANPEQLPRMHCPGSLTEHIDGCECTAGSRCPGGTVPHSSRSAHHAGGSWDRDCERCAAAASRRGGVTAGPARPGGLS
jgi:hypothetical protein